MKTCCILVTLPLWRVGSLLSGSGSGSCFGCEGLSLGSILLGCLRWRMSASSRLWLNRRQRRALCRWWLHGGNVLMVLRGGGIYRWMSLWWAPIYQETRRWFTHSTNLRRTFYFQVGLFQPLPAWCFPWWDSRDTNVRRRLTVLIWRKVRVLTFCCSFMGEGRVELFRLALCSLWEGRPWRWLIWWEDSWDGFSCFCCECWWKMSRWLWVRRGTLVLGLRIFVVFGFRECRGSS